MIKKFKHIEYEEENGKLYRIAGLFRFPMQDLQSELEKDKKAFARIKENGPTPYPLPKDYITDENWEDEIYLPTGVYPQIGGEQIRMDE